jgi:hypothetical protein
MSATVYIYPIEVTDQQVISLPEGAEILTAQVQRGQVCLWARVDAANSATLTERKIRVAGTGHSVSLAWHYIGTVQLLGGDLVFHFFEEVSV